VGFLLSIYYSIQYCRICPKNASNLPGTVNQHVKFVLFFLISSVLIVGCLAKDISLNIIGKLGVSVCILLFASPLSTLKTVVRTKSASSIPLPFTLACMLNCFLWSVAGLLEMKDFYIYFPNILGLASSVAQLSLRILYGEGRSPLPL